jgi:DNA invertase Pin-like site-specific DNA recombinase
MTALPALTDDRPVYDVIVRVSKVGYREDTLDSDRDQEARCRGEIERRGGRVGIVHVEKDVSGKTTNRKALNDARARVLSGAAHGVVAAYVSRFSRNTVEGLELVQSILGAGREFVALDLGGMDLRTVGGEQFLTMQLGQARAEWRMRQDSFNEARRKAIARGAHLVEPFGYRKGATGSLEPHPTEAPIVLGMFERRAAGASWHAITNWLNDAGITTKVYGPRRDGKATKRTAGKWRHNVVKRVIENRVYLGEAKSGDYSNLTAHEPIVSVALFAKCETLRDLRPRRGAADYELSGILRCAECGERMKGNTNRNGERVYRYYRCPQGACKVPGKVRADRIEAAVAELFADVARGLRVFAVQSTDNLGSAMDALAAAEGQRDTIAADIDLLAANRPAYMAAVAAAEQRVTDARSAVAVTRQRVTGVSVTDDELAGWSGLPIDARRRFLAEAFECVYLSGDRAGFAPIVRGELADADRVRGHFLTLA